MTCRHQEGDPACSSRNARAMAETAMREVVRWGLPPGWFETLCDGASTGNWGKWNVARNHGAKQWYVGPDWFLREVPLRMRLSLGVPQTSVVARTDVTALPASPDPGDYEILEAVPVGANLVLRVRYPSCEACAFEGTKVLVYRNVGLADAIRWKRIDPHFRDPTLEKSHPRDAPPPDARFPASEVGWRDALAWAGTTTP